MDEIKKHIYDLKYLAVKLGKLKLEDGKKIEDVEFSISDAIQASLEFRLLDLDKDISNIDGEKNEISQNKLKALRVLGEIHKSLRGERTVVRNEGGSTGKENELQEKSLEALRKSLRIEPIEK